jgi:hypothetical protein
MEDPSLPPAANDLGPNLQIQQDLKGNQNQMIGQVLGGMVVYGQVIYNNPSVETDSAAKADAAEIGPNPYKGLLAFQETDGDRFFGRDPQIEGLWEKFQELHEEESATRLLTIYGPSGSGKSSLARAGLIPELARRPLPGRDRARVAVLVPGSHPLEALATVLARIATNDLTPVAKTREFADELKQANAEGVYDGLRRIADAMPEIAISPLIVLVDQLEEVFTLCEDSAERDVFICNLLCAAAERSKRVSAIVTVRSDFLGATQKYPRLNQLISPQGFFVPAMNKEGLREAIIEPAKSAGHPLDLSTVNLLIEQTEGREGALPLLQFALTRIWAGLTEDKEPAETLRAIGGVGGALAGEAQRIYESLTPEEQEIARRVFLGLVQLGEGTKDTRRRTELGRVVSHQDNLELVKKVIARFADPGARLITLADKDKGTETVEVTHESLFEHWQQLKDWLVDSRNDLRFQRRLDEAAFIWQENGRPKEGNLWRPPDLDFLRQYYERAGNGMTPLQLDFFDASYDLDTKVKNERRRQQIIQFSLLSIMAFGILYIGRTHIIQSLRSEVTKIAEGLKPLSPSTNQQPVGAVLVAITKMKPSQSTLMKSPSHSSSNLNDRSLIDTIFSSKEKNRLQGDKSSFYSASFSPDGKRIVSGSVDKTVRVWDAITGAQIGKPLYGHESLIYSASFSPDGKRIVSGSADKTVRVWDAITGAQIGKPLYGHKDAVKSVSFSPDGKRIASGSLDETVRVWDASTEMQISEPLHGHTGAVNSVSFSPDGKRIVSGSDDHTVRIWSTGTAKQSNLPVQEHEGAVNSVSFSPDGKRIVSGSADKTVRVWDAGTGILIENSLKGHSDDINSVSFSPDGKLIVSGSDDHTARIWDLSWDFLLLVTCNKLRYHPSLSKPATDTAREAKQICQRYVWTP